MVTPTATPAGTYKPRYDTNQLVIEGNLGRDPEMRYTPQGNAVTTATIGVQAGNVTRWFRIEAWRDAAQKLNEEFSKGDKVRVCGHVKLDEWDGNDERSHAQMIIETGRYEDITLVFAKGGASSLPEDEAPPQDGDDGFDPFAILDEIRTASQARRRKAA